MWESNDGEIEGARGRESATGIPTGAWRQKWSGKHADGRWLPNGRAAARSGQSPVRSRVVTRSQVVSSTTATSLPAKTYR